MMTATANLSRAVTQLVDAVRAYLPEPIAQPTVPNPTVYAVRVAERTVGLGGRRGSDSGSVGHEALKGVRVDGSVRVQRWGSTPSEVEGAVQALVKALLDDLPALHQRGFLTFSLDRVSVAEHVDSPTLRGWRQTADFDVLYEYQFQDTDGAESLITRIPIGIEETFDERTIVTDPGLVRWDDASAPLLAVRGPAEVSRLAALAFLSEPPPAGHVTVTRTFDGTTDPPVDLATLPNFLARTGGDAPDHRNAFVRFPSIAALLGALGGTDSTLEMGDFDLDQNPDVYERRALTFAAPIQLHDAADRLEIAFEDAAFTRKSVVYLRSVLSTTASA